MKTRKLLIWIFLILSNMVIFAINNEIQTDDTINFRSIREIDEEQENRESAPRSSSMSNYDILQTIIDTKINDLNTYGYFPQHYRPSLIGTYYALFILDAIGKLNEINQSETISYVMNCYSMVNEYFEDDFSNRYLDAANHLELNTYESLLMTNCYAVWSLEILGALPMINTQDMIDFIWSCYNQNESGFIGQPYSPGLAPHFKDSTLANTYWAIITLDLLMTSWSSHISERNSLISWIEGLQIVSAPYKYNKEQWARGGFAEDYNLITAIAEGWYVNILNCYQAIKALDVFGYADSINMTEIRNYVARLYDDVNFKFMFDCSFEGTIGYRDISSSAIGIQVADLVSFLSFDRTAVLDFVLNGRNSKGYWYTSNCFRSFHELINSYQVIRSLQDAGELSLLSLTAKENLADAIISDFYSYNGGFAILAKNHMDLVNPFSTVESIYIFDRMAEVDKNTLYDIVKIMGVEQNAFRGYFYGISDTYDTTLTSYYGLRINPFEIDCKGTSSHSDVYNSKFDHEKSYMALELLNRIFKLNDFDGSFDLNKSRDNVVLSQCLNPSYPDVYGGFFPNKNSRGDLSGIYLDNAYWAIRTLELYIDYKGEGSLDTIGIDIAALSSYVSSKIIETPFLIYSQPAYSDKPEDILEHTYYLIYLLKTLGLYNLDNNRIENLIELNIDYENVKNLYYCNKIIEILDLNLDFNLEYAQNFVKSAFSEELDEYFLSSEHTIIDHQAFLWISEMALQGKYEIECTHKDTVNLGGIQNINAKVNNIILSNDETDFTIELVSESIGLLDFVKDSDGIYHLSYFIPVDPSIHPHFKGTMYIYLYNTLVAKHEVVFETTYELIMDSNIEKKSDFSADYLDFEISLSYKFESENVPASQSSILVMVYHFHNKTGILETEEFMFYKEGDSGKYTIFTFKYELDEFETKDFIIFHMFLHDDFNFRKLILSYDFPEKPTDDKSEDKGDPESEYPVSTTDWISITLIAVIIGAAFITFSGVVISNYRKNKKNKNREILGPKTSSFRENRNLNPNNRIQSTNSNESDRSEVFSFIGHKRVNRVNMQQVESSRQEYSEGYPLTPSDNISHQNDGEQELKEFLKKYAKYLGGISVAAVVVLVYFLRVSLGILLLSGGIILLCIGIFLFFTGSVRGAFKSFIISGISILLGLTIAHIPLWLLMILSGIGFLILGIHRKRNGGKGQIYFIIGASILFIGLLILSVLWILLTVLDAVFSQALSEISF